jgi:hypothetical protein
VLKEAGRPDDLTQVDPFTFEHGETHPRDPDPSPGPAPVVAPVMAPGTAVDPAAVPLPGTVGMVEARPPPEPPPIPIPPAPPPPAPVLEPELPTAWAAYSSKVPSGGRSVKRVALALVLVVALASGAVVFFFGRGSSGGAALAMSFHQGQVLKYRVHLTSDLEFTAAGQIYPLKADVTELVAMHVVGVGSDGTATVKVVASHAKGVINGTRLPPVLRKPQKVSVDSIEQDGRLTESDLKKDSLTSFDLVPTSDEVVSLLPDHPVEPGDTWTRDATATFPLAGAGPLHLSEQITFVRYQKFHGTRAAVLQDHASIPLDLTLDAQSLLEALGGRVPDSLKGADLQLVYGGTVTQDVTSWFDPAGGRMLSFSGRATVDATIQATGTPGGTSIPPMTVSGTLAFSLAPPGHHAKKTS